MPQRHSVDFVEMQHGTAEEYALLRKHEADYNRQLVDRLVHTLQQLESSLSGYKVSRLEHSLQSATRAYTAGEDEQMVVAALLHDIGDPLAPYSHSEMAAAILRPFVSERIYWIIKHHGLFQTYYYAHYFGEDRHARERFKQHIWYQDCVDFCARYDQNCFDPDYVSKPLAFFRPMLARVFAKPLWPSV